MDRTTHERLVETAFETRVARLRSATGWLSLVGKIFLSEGTVRLGAGDDCEAKLPDGAPAYVGTLTLQGGRVTFSAAPGVDARIGDERVETRALRSDHGGAADALVVSGFVLEVMERNGTFALRVRDVRELPRPFPGIARFDFDPTWRLRAKLERHSTPKTVELDFEGGPDEAGGVTGSFTSPGDVVFEAEGAHHRLEALLADASSGRLFILFRDATSGKESYALGRFIYTDAPDAEGNVDLEMNSAMLPGCAFSIYATCPIPPRQNKLAVAVRAGERELLGKAIGEP